MAGEKLIFISYRREDVPVHAGRLFDRLASRFGEESVFMDTTTIKPGDEFPAAIENALNRAVAAVVLMGERWATGASGRIRIQDTKDYVRQEIATLLRRGVRIIPILVDSTRLPAEEELPDELRPFLHRQTFRLRSDNFGTDAAQLIANIAEAVEAHERPDPLEVERHKKRLKVQQNYVARAVKQSNGGWLDNVDTLPALLVAASHSDEQVEKMLWSGGEYSWSGPGRWVAATSQRLRYVSREKEYGAFKVTGSTEYSEIEKVELRVAVEKTLFGKVNPSASSWTLEILAADADYYFSGTHSRGDLEKAEQFASYVTKRMRESKGLP